jgi:hypothetical protein
MPGNFGTTNTDNGVYASTTSSANFGAFGNNQSLDAPTGGGAGGAGVLGLTSSPGAAGVFGANTASKGVGVQGNGPEAGISGFSDTGVGLRAHSNHADACDAFAHDPAGNGVLAMNDATTAPAPGGAPKGNGILAVTTVPGAAGAFGANNNATQGVGVQGNGPEAGVSGFSENGVGLRAHSNHGDGTQSFAHSNDHNGLLGLNDATTPNQSTGAPAGNGVYGYTDVPNASGVCGAVAASNNAGAGVTGIGPTAGKFFGNVVVTGDIQLTGADYAEDFDVVDSEHAAPGCVMVLDDAGALRESRDAYDSRVAGVVCGAGDFRPAVILDRRNDAAGRRMPVALVGKVFCKIDASYEPVRVGDLLTTSPTPGHAMRASDRGRAFGSVLGKALRGLDSGCGLVPVLVTLQ